MAPVTDRANLYGDAGAGKVSEVARDALARVYVPNLQSNDVTAFAVDASTGKMTQGPKVGVLQAAVINFAML